MSGRLLIDFRLDLFDRFGRAGFPTNIRLSIQSAQYSLI
jgi:hypothetical protein